jgi:hypothetical protein
MTNKKMSATDMTDEEYNEWLEGWLVANLNSNGLDQRAREAPNEIADPIERPKEQQRRA